MVLAGGAFGRWLDHMGGDLMNGIQFSLVHSLSDIWLFVTPWTPGLPVHHQLPESTQTLD